MSYESVNFFEKTLRKFLIFLLPISFCEFLFIRRGSLGRKLKKLATTHKALEMIYDYSWANTKGRSMGERFVTHYLLHFFNARAVRNRFKSAKEIIRNAICSSSKKEIRILSLASGSARDISEVIEAMSAADYKYKITLVDVSKNALQDAAKNFYATQEVVSLALEKQPIEEFIKNTQDSSFDVILMVGFLDYLDDFVATDIISDIYRSLSSGGVFITCNVRNNPEKPFMDKVLKWPMVYRTPEGLADIMRRSGFQHSRIDLRFLLGVHMFAIGQKMRNP